MKKYNLIVSGGTFDYFHAGHKAFLNKQLEMSNKIVLGITSDEFAREKDMVLEPYAKRLQKVEQFLASINARNRVDIEKIDTIFIPNTWNTLPIEAIVVTEDSIKGAEEINKNRIVEGLSVLEVVQLPLEKAEDGRSISSTRIRRGEISREGRLYVQPAWLNHDLLLPEALRTALQEPFGVLHKEFPKHISLSTDQPLITVGDVVTRDMNKQGTECFLSIIDFRVERKEIFTDYRELGFTGKEKIIQVNNPAGHITSELFLAIKQTFDLKEKSIIHVNGEEDLAVLPVVLCAPLDARILYGQPGIGVVEVIVDEDTKNKAYSIVSQFKIG